MTVEHIGEILNLQESRSGKIERLRALEDKALLLHAVVIHRKDWLFTVCREWGVNPNIKYNGVSVVSRLGGDLKVLALFLHYFPEAMGGELELQGRIGDYRDVLHDALKNPDVSQKALRKLLLSGVDVSRENVDGELPLLSSFYSKQHFFLLNSGADPTKKNSYGQTMLHRLVLLSGSEGAVHDFYIFKDVANEKNGNGNSALDLAIKMRRDKLIRGLIYIGSVGSKYTYLEKAYRGDLSEVDLNLPYGDKVCAAYAALHGGQTEAFKTLLNDWGVKLDEKNPDFTYEGFMDAAARLNNVEVLQFLIDSQHTLSKHNTTSAIQCAFERGHVEVSEYLLKQGAKVSAKEIRRIVQGGLVEYPLNIRIKLLQCIKDAGFDLVDLKLFEFIVCYEKWDLIPEVRAMGLEPTDECLNYLKTMNYRYSYRQLTGEELVEDAIS